MPQLKYYFAVNNSYVINKLRLILFPFRHKSWGRLSIRTDMNGQTHIYRLPRDDLNAPDLYIPLMSLVSYILLVAIAMGRRKLFKPEVLGLAASSAILCSVIEVCLIKFGCYVLNITSSEGGGVALLDIISYAGYKYVGILLTMAGFLLFGNPGYILLFFYTALTTTFFILRTLRLVVLPDGASTVLSPQRKRRNYFLLMIAAMQIAFAFYLTKSL